MMNCYFFLYFVIKLVHHTYGHKMNDVNGSKYMMV
jgi:hypothetical protein